MYTDEEEPDFFEPEFEPEPMEWLPASQRRPSGCLIAVSVGLVIILLVTALSGLFWLLSLRERPTAIKPLTPTAVPASTATALPNTPESAVKEPAAAEPSPVPPSAFALNRIAFIDNDGQIATIAPDGSELHLLTEGNEIFGFPAWSPDGQHIAVIGNNRLGASVTVVADEESAGEPQQLYFGNRNAPFYLY